MVPVIVWCTETRNRIGFLTALYRGLTFAMDQTLTGPSLGRRVYSPLQYFYLRFWSMKPLDVL